MDVNFLKSLIGRLDDTCRNALQGAAGLCLARTNYDVDIEHLLVKLLDVSNSDLERILKYYEINPGRLVNDLTRALDKLKTGNARTPDFSPHLPQVFQEAWLLASIEYGAANVRSGHVLLALLTNDSLARLAREISKEFNSISVESLRKKLPEITAGSVEDSGAKTLAADGSSAGTIGDGPAAAMGGKAKALDQFTVDLTAKARSGKIDPVLGRDFEIRQVIDILTRRRQNNPILTGEAGVGKTAVVEGFALRIAQGDVPGPLKNVAVRTLDLGLLQAGAGIKGEFENRLKSVIDEVKASPQPIILFIDEAHTMIGAGGQAGQNDAANLLKPALARGELRTIAATTWAEYKKYFEKDAALARRFQVVKVEEPSEEQAIVMMRGLTETLEKHHNVRILEEGVADAVKLSHRYITGRQLPDKAVSVLDTACAKVAIGQGATPPAIEDATRRTEQYQVEINALQRESIKGTDHDERLEELKAAKTLEEERLLRLNKQWELERDLVSRKRDVRTQLEDYAAKNGAESTIGKTEAAAPIGVAAGAAVASAPSLMGNGEGAAGLIDVEALKAQLSELDNQLSEIQGESPLMQATVNSQSIAEVISGWTGIPVGKMLTDEINVVLNLHEKLQQRVIGQTHALQAIAQRIRTARANLTDPRRPVGVFLLVGPSGVGKTETALTLADTLYGGERNLVSINMSEYQEAHTVSSLKGSPPGYVGYGEGGVLTEAVRRKPYTVVKLCADPETKPLPDALVEAIRPELIKVFKPALLGRMVVVPYYPISDEVMREIIKLQLGRIGRRIEENHDAEFTYEDAVVAEIANRCKEVESGARNVDHILTRTVLPEMSGEFLSRMATGQPVSSVQVRVGEGGVLIYDIN